MSPPASEPFGHPSVNRQNYPSATTQPASSSGVCYILIDTPRAADKSGIARSVIIRGFKALIYLTYMTVTRP